MCCVVKVLRIVCWFCIYIPGLHWRLDCQSFLLFNKTAFKKSRGAFPILRSHENSIVSLTVHGHFVDAPRLPLTIWILMFTGNKRRPSKGVKLY